LRGKVCRYGRAAKCNFRTDDRNFAEGVNAITIKETGTQARKKFRQRPLLTLGDKAIKPLLTAVQEISPPTEDKTHEPSLATTIHCDSP
jgi:hypothetical protein